MMKQAAIHIPIKEPNETPQKGHRPSLGGLALFRLGFRPFYLLAALFALLSIPLWLVSYSGGVQIPNVNLLWHMHEMVFGFAVAVVVGFLFTAARNWTGLWTPQGWRLAAIVGTWIIGRVGMLMPSSAIGAGLDLLFIPVAMVPLYRVMWRSGKRRNLPLLGLLALLFIANLFFHANTFGLHRYSAIEATEAAILVLAVLSTVMGGRVIPGFTTNMAPGSKPKTFERLDKASVTLVIVASLAWVTTGLAPWLTAALAGGSGLLQLARLAFWSPQRTARYPLLWILHLAYAWIGGGYLLLAAASLGIASVSSAMHAIAVGGMSSLILGMIARTTIGHTGRLMRAEHHELLIFVAVQCAAVARILANIAPSGIKDVLLVAAGLCWVIAFGTYAVVFGPFLCTPRLDGRDG
ncbi:NnrS family protein [Duganella sp. LjRoot269]|uniref:NnrS family protein n=1 Tax=Duganella sp. LjRoot269 TaxID=3342305 RepID=UPI003ED03956